MYRLVQKEGEECKFVAKIDEESSTGTVLAEVSDTKLIQTNTLNHSLLN
jgi:hypothetical protein